MKGGAVTAPAAPAIPSPSPDDERFHEEFYRGTTSIETADAEGWVVSITPSGGWVPAVIAGRTGVGLSQRMQSFVTDPADGPFNVVEPGKRPRVTLTPTMALKDGLPFLSFAVQGGDSQDQNLLQFFLNVVEFGMTVQQAVEAPNMNSFQMRTSFGSHEARPGRMLLADAEGWVVSITPSGGWVPAVIAGRTGVGLSQRLQSFVTDPAEGPFNVLRPGQLPRVTLTPSMALKDGKPFLSFAVQGGDSQDQNLLQFFLNIVEFGMTVQQAVEAPNINSLQMRSSFGAHEMRPGHMTVASSLPEASRQALRQMGYTLDFSERTSGPINAIFFDRKHRTMWGGSSNHGEDYGIGW